MKFELGLSRRAYAKRRGCTDKAVRNAIGNAQMHGRIWEALLPDGTINADLADQLWERNTDPSQRRGREAMRAEVSMAALIARDAARIEQPVADAVEEPAASQTGDIEPEAEEVDEVEEQVATRPVPLDPSDFEEDPPRRKALSDDEMDAAEALAAHVAANRGRAAAGLPRPSDGAPITEDAEALLALALEEKREKVRKLRIANDEKEKLLIPAAQAEAHAFSFVRAISEAWQMWPDGFAPDLAAKHGIESRVLTQDLRDGVREQLSRMAGAEAMRLDA